MRTSLKWETVRYSPNLTPRVVFGRFPWMTNPNCSEPLSHHLDVFVLTDYHLVSAPLCPRYFRAWKGHSARWMISSFNGADHLDHDGRVRAVLHRLQGAGLTHNDRCEFLRSSFGFLAHIIDSSGRLRADPQKTTAVTQFPVPSDVSGIQRFTGMVNHLGKCIPNLADLSDPLRPLLRKDSLGEPQQKAFEQIKQALVSPTVLAHYNTNRSTIIPVDAFNTGSWCSIVLFIVHDDGERRLKISQ